MWASENWQLESLQSSFHFLFQPKKKSASFIPRPPSSHRPTSTRRIHRLSATPAQRLSNAQVLSPFKRTPLLPPVGQPNSQYDIYPPQESNKWPVVSMHSQGTANDLTHSISRTELGRLIRQSSTSVGDSTQEIPRKRSARIKRSGSGSNYHHRYIQPHYQLLQQQQDSPIQGASNEQNNRSNATTDSLNLNGSLVLSGMGEVLKLPGTADGMKMSDCIGTLMVSAEGNGSPVKCGRDSATQTDNIDIHLAQSLESSLSLRGHTPSMANGIAEEYSHNQPPPTILEELPNPVTDPDSPVSPPGIGNNYVSISTNTDSGFHPVGRLNRQVLSPNHVDYHGFSRTQSPIVLQAGLIVTDNTVSRGKSGLLRQISLERLGTSKLINTSTNVTSIPIPTPPTTMRSGAIRTRSGLASAGLTRSGNPRESRVGDAKLLVSIFVSIKFIKYENGGYI